MKVITLTLATILVAVSGREVPDLLLRCTQHETMFRWPSYHDSGKFFVCDDVGGRQLTVECKRGEVFSFVLQMCTAPGKYIPPPAMDLLPTSAPALDLSQKPQSQSHSHSHSHSQSLGGHAVPVAATLAEGPAKPDLPAMLAELPKPLMPGQGLSVPLMPHLPHLPDGPHPPTVDLPTPAPAAAPTPAPTPAHVSAPVQPVEVDSPSVAVAPPSSKPSIPKPPTSSLKPAKPQPPPSLKPAKPAAEVPLPPTPQPTPPLVKLTTDQPIASPTKPSKKQLPKVPVKVKNN